MNVSNILFLDTESDIHSKKPECVQWLLGSDKGIIEIFDKTSFIFLENLWNNAEAVVFFNAPYDMGVLSICYSENSYKWETTITKGGLKSSSWSMHLFNNNYQVRRLAFVRNFIKGRKRGNRVSKITKHGKHIGKEYSILENSDGHSSTPVIDLLKLWSILISDTDLKLKKIIHRELKRDVITFTPEISKTEEYRYQDVVGLRDVFNIFIEKIKFMPELEKFTALQWSKMSTPASFSKHFYDLEYDMINDQKHNNIQIANSKLANGLEMAFHGGITLSMYRGKVDKIAWFDIKGAYSKAISVLNTDKYNRFNIIKCESITDDSKPYLCKVKSNFIMTSLNKSLKLFYVEIHGKQYIWNFDIYALNNLIPDFKYKIIECYQIIPLLKIDNSLPEKWDKLKNDEFTHHGKTTLYHFYKFLSNTSYGIRAQRNPYVTKFTNMCIAGMITSKVHQILSIIIKTGEKQGYTNIYNDTDSCAFKYTNVFNEKLTDDINQAIAPFEVEFEGLFHDNEFLSLKRYKSISDNPEKNKIKLHGKGRYKIGKNEILNYLNGNTINNDELLILSNMSCNTEISMKQFLNIYPQCERYKHPFMFNEGVKTDRLKCEFMGAWYNHIDTKTSYQKSGSFIRKFHHFKSIVDAKFFFIGKLEMNNIDDIDDKRHWDKEIKQDFNYIIPKK